MATARITSQTGFAHSRAPSSRTEQAEEDIEAIFDWQRYCNDFPLDDGELFNWQNYSDSSQLDARAAQQKGLPQLIQEIPSVLQSFQDLAVERLENDFSNMNASLHLDDVAESTSDYTGGTSPPGLVPTRSTSPSEHWDTLPLDHIEDQLVHNVTLKQAQAQDDEWTYPQKEDMRKAVNVDYPSHIPNQDTRVARGVESSPSLKRRRSGVDIEKRQRHLADPVQTADVRKTGACVPCRVSKTKCHESGVCPKCTKDFPDHSQMVCIRKTPALNVPAIRSTPDLWSEDASEEEALYGGPRFYIGKSRSISVFLTQGHSSASMRVNVQAYRQSQSPEHPGNLRYCGFPRDEVPSHELLKSWVEDQIKRDYKPTFQSALQNFIYAYCKGGSGLPRHRLASGVHGMNCFFTIWKTSSFLCLDPLNKPVDLPLSVQAQLRNIAKKGLDLLEHDVLKELDGCLAQQGKLQEPDLLVIWACMWQLLLMYREILIAFKKHLDTTEETGPSLSKKQQCYKWLGDVVYPLLSVFYHYQFRTKKSLELSVDWLKPAVQRIRKLDMDAIGQTCQALLNSRKVFYAAVQSSQEDVDRLLSILVVNHEVKKMNARRRTTKPGVKPQKGVKGKPASEFDDDE